MGNEAQMSALPDGAGEAYSCEVCVSECEYVCVVCVFSVCIGCGDSCALRLFFAFTTI